MSETRENLRGTDSTLVTAILVMAVLYFAREVFVPLALAGLLAFLLAPVASQLERWRVRRTPAALLVIFLALAGAGSLGWLVLGQIYNLAVELPQYQQNVTTKIDALHLNSAGRLSSTAQMVANIRNQLRGGKETAPIMPLKTKRRAPVKSLPTTPDAATKGEPQPMAVRVEEPEPTMLAVAGRTVMPLLHPLTTTFIVVIFLIFMLLGRERLRDRGMRLAGSGRMHVTTTAIEDASRRVSRYLQMQLVVNLCYGCVSALLLWLIGVPNPLLWGVLTCVLRFIPYIGILIAVSGPILLSIAVAPGWREMVWTMVMYFVLEVVTANFLEPMLYGSSTGISAIAILIAAIFWTLLWGLPGLLLSTPLTVCLVVIGRQVPHLYFLDVLFGEEAELPPPERFYQRMLASNVQEARGLVEEMLKAKPREEVYDSVLVPSLSMVEEARHSEEMTGARAEEVLQAIEELAEEVTSKAVTVATAEAKPDKEIVCVPARDFADEVACQLALQAITGSASARVVAADMPTQEMLESIEKTRADVICVIGIPPSAIRHIRLRCHQIRARFPEVVVMACVLSKESDLSNLRSRIPTEDAQHVVSSLQLMKEYLTSLLHPGAAQEAEASREVEEKANRDLNETVAEMEQKDVFDGPEDGIFGRLAENLARSFDAPIALITVVDGQRRFWEAQCGLPDDAVTTKQSERDLSICSRITFNESTLVVPDTAEDERFANDPFLKEKGIRFYAGAPLKSQDGTVIGSLCVLDTRPRQVTEQQREVLTTVANSVMMAIELHGTVQPEEMVTEPVAGAGERA